MIEGSVNVILITVRRLLRRSAFGSLRKIIRKTHPADLARVFRSLSPLQQKQIFNLVTEKDTKGRLLKGLSKDDLSRLVQGTSSDELIRIFECLPLDEVADLMGLLPGRTAGEVLQRMPRRDREKLKKLLQFDDRTAGGIMIPDYVALDENTTARQAVYRIQHDFRDIEMAFYLYVVNAEGQLTGVCSLRQLVTIPAETALCEFMTREVLSVQTGTDQEEVARITERYNLLAVPVVDDRGRLVGIVTVDDIIDIIRDETTEDMLKMAGAGADYAETKSVMSNMKARLPWLLASCIGGLGASLIIGRFEEALNQLVYLAAFIPVIMGMGGNIGTQSSTIMVRGLATQYIQLGNPWQAAAKEIAIGGILGVIYGLLLATVAFSRFQMIRLGLVVGGSVLLSMSISSIVGTMVPILLARLKIDPAVSTGPFVTTTIDIFAVWAYFIAATHMLGI